MSNTNNPIENESTKIAQEVDPVPTCIYDDETIRYLLYLLTEEDKRILLDIYTQAAKDILNYQRTKVPDYKKNRRKYELSWAKLEAQGFIKPYKVAQMNLFQFTENGLRAIKLLTNEK